MVPKTRDISGTSSLGILKTACCMARRGGITSSSELTIQKDEE
jgi:hypothetical protein